VLGWLVEAAEHLRAFSRYVRCEVHVRQVQWDALDAVWRDVKEGKLSEEEAIKRLERSTDHVWTLQEGPPLSGATVAPTPRTLRDSAENAGEPKQDGGIVKQGNRAGRDTENSLRRRMTG